MKKKALSFLLAMAFLIPMMIFSVPDVAAEGAAPDYYINFDDAEYIKSLSGPNNVALSHSDNALRVQITGGDPFFSVALPIGSVISTDEYRYVRIAMMNTSPVGGKGGFFFGTEINPGPAGPDNTQFDISNNDTNYQYYVVDMIDQCAQPGRWTGALEAFRIDPIDDGTEQAGAVIYIKYIAFFKTKEEALAFEGDVPPNLTMDEYLDSRPIKGTAPPVSYPADHPIYALDVMADTWVGVDGLGRVIPTADNMKYTNHLGDEVDYSLLDRPEKKRDVGIFYWTWHYNFANRIPANVTELMKQYPDLNKNDFNDPRWSPGGFDFNSYQNFWDEPLFGYYNGAVDNWVLRRHAEMLADAGVDVMIFDCTNGTYTWRAAYRNVLEVFTQARADGVNTPQVAFLLPFSAGSDTNTQLRLLYLDIYRDGKYQDLWYYWNGKPLIMAHPNGLGNDKLSNELKSFFTYRPGNPLYYNGSANSSANSGSGVPAYPLWDWASMYPQRVSGNAHHTNNRTLVQGTAGNREEMSVTVAQNWTYNSTVSGGNPGGTNPHGGLTAMNGTNILGRSTYRTQESFAQNSAMNPGLYQKDMRGIAYGANLAQQFDYAIRMDPDFLFITGWNEWIMGRFDSWPPTNLAVTNAFPDQYNEEFSRDIEPSKNSVLKDHYYNQMVSYIRLYKGVSPIPEASKKNSIDIAGDAKIWDSVAPTFRSYQNNIGDRDASGFSGYRYTDSSGRNDIIEAKVAHDSDNIYFMVKTKDALSPYTDPDWMRLLISTEGIEGANWEGYQYIINRISPSANKAFLERSSGGWSWNAAGEVSYNVAGNMLTIEIPKESLGISGDHFTLDFKWTDNTLGNGGGNDILDFYQYGDTAPGGRFNYRYIAEFDGITVDSITVNPSVASLDPGALFKFEAVVHGDGAPTQKVTWTVEGGAAGTSISPNGVLTIAANETADELTVRAASTQETYTGISGAATVTVIPFAVDASVSAYVTVKNGNKNELTITIEQTLSNGKTNEITETFSISNNAAAVYELGGYRVYVDTKGNNQIRDCRLVDANFVPPEPGPEAIGPALAGALSQSFNKDEREDVSFGINWGEGVLAASAVSSVSFGGQPLAYGIDYAVFGNALTIAKDYLFAQTLGAKTLTVTFDDWESTQASAEIDIYFETQAWLSTLQGWTRFYPMADPNVPFTDSPKYIDFMDFMTDASGVLWGDTIAGTDVISLFADVLGGSADITDAQLDAFCAMVKNNGVKVAAEMYGFQWCDLSSGDNPTQEEWKNEAASWFDVRYRYLFTRLAERGVGVEYVDLDGTINRIMNTNPGPGGQRAGIAYNHVTRGDAVQLIVYFMEAVQDFYSEPQIASALGKAHDVKFNYIVNFPNHGWRAGGLPGGASQRAITMSGDGYSNAFDDMVALTDAVRAARAPMLGFILDSPYNYYAQTQAGNSTLNRMLQYESYVRSLGFTAAVVFNDEVAYSAPADKAYYENTLKAVRDYKAAGGNPEIYMVESWYAGSPSVCVPETEPYSLTYLMRDVIRSVKYGWAIHSEFTSATIKTPAMTWKWPGSGTLPSGLTGIGGRAWTDWTSSGANGDVSLAMSGNTVEIICVGDNPYISTAAGTSGNSLSNVDAYPGAVLGIGRIRLSTALSNNNGGCDQLRIRIKNATELTTGKFSFLKGSVWYDVPFDMLPASQEPDWQDVIIDLGLDSDWNGTVTQLRIYPALGASAGDYFEIELIEFTRHTINTTTIEEIFVIEP